MHCPSPLNFQACRSAVAPKIVTARGDRPFADLTDWDLARVLYRWEAYIGWRSRLLYSINTPYLWSFSNHYTKGKFVADNVWAVLEPMVDAQRTAAPQ